MKKYKLFLDDVRMPNHVFGYIKNQIYLSDDWAIVRNYDEFVDHIENGWLHDGFPRIISFDHDLAYFDQESWTPILGYEDIYEISTLGRINRIKINKGTSGGVLNLNKNESGLYVYLYKYGKRKRYLVHRLVLESFVGVNKDKPQVNHLDGNRWNNKIINLEWCTGSENVKHSHDHLNREYTAYGENHNNSRKISKYNKNYEYICTYGGVNEAGRQEKISFTNIAKCARGERKTAGGFIWKYDNRDVTIKSPIIFKPKEKKNYDVNFFIPELQEKTGMDCAKWLINFCMDNKLLMPEYYIHSMNPVGSQNILSILNNYKRLNEK